MTMHIALSKLPTVAYAKEPFLALIEDGYALPIQTQGDATVMLFKDVDDHIDGNGLSLLWMLEGEGTFFYKGQALAFKKGDAVVFDDRIEHGFEANDYCLAASFDIALATEWTPEFIVEILDAFQKSHNTPADLLPGSPTFY